MAPKADSAMTTVIVADPDRQIRRLIGSALRFAGYAVEAVGTPAQAASLLRRRQIGALVVDPVETGSVDTVMALRTRTDVPILVVSHFSDEADKVAALDAGADDYLTKPVGMEELLARLRVVLRRAHRTDCEDTPIIAPDFTIHLSDRRWVRSDGTDVRLTPIEWRLVEVLVGRAGHLVTQADLLRRVWGPNAVDKTHYLRVYVAAIRRKVEPDPARPRYFITAPGLGLLFDPTPLQAPRVANASNS
jgi:two-component system, OmpR family, KDP operon response regulator KdpE